MKNKKWCASIICIALTTMFLTACGSENEFDVAEYEKSIGLSDGAEATPKPINPEDFQDSSYYIRHTDGTYEPLYLGKHTFSTGSKSENAKSSRVCWFQDDFDKIPTLYKGDNLVYYSTSFIPYNYYFERYEDIGYSIGLANIKVDQTGRYFFEVSKDDVKMYAYSDTDQFLYLTNNKLIIESIGGLRCRFNPYETVYDKKISSSEMAILQEYIDYYAEDGSTFNLSGIDLNPSSTLKFADPDDTIAIKDNTYTFQILDGTIKKDVDIRTNIRILSSFEVRKSMLFDFDTENNVIVLPIPDCFNSGYYLINGVGLFRYVTDTSFDPDKPSSFNEPNDYSHDTQTKDADIEDIDNNNGNMLDTKSIQPAAQKEAYDYSNSTTSLSDLQGGVDPNSNKTYSATMNVVKTGDISLSITFTDKAGNNTTDITKVKATITAPNGEKYGTTNKGGAIYASFNAKETGAYKITYENLGTLLPKVAVQSN